MSVSCRSSVVFTVSQLQTKFVSLVRMTLIMVLLSGRSTSSGVLSRTLVVISARTWRAHYSASPGNPNYTLDELVHMIILTKCTLVIAHPACQETILAAAQVAGLPQSRIIFLREAPSNYFSTVDSLIAFGESSPERFQERLFSSGEARKALAFLSLSSGTTGLPKVGLLIGHQSIVAH
ncbi:hypothetical protein Ac2012v2_006693 [Leucoagaricus gongylophorus]